MTDNQVILYINMWDSICGECRLSCDPYEISHVKPMGWDRHEGCGATYTHLSTHYYGNDDVQEMRPDLPWIAPGEDES